MTRLVFLFVGILISFHPERAARGAMYFEQPNINGSMMDGMKPPFIRRVVRLERLERLVALRPPIFGRTSNPLTPRTSLPAEADD